MALSLRHGASLDNDPSIQFGSKTVDVSINAATPIFHAEDVSVAASHTRATLWATGQGGISAFVFGVLLSDSDIYIELKNSKGTPEYVLHFVPANIPFYFGYNESGSTTQRLDGALLVAGTDYSPIAQIMVQNESLTTAAVVSLYLFN